MKTSNIILLSLIGSITFLILAGAMQLRFTGEKRSAYLESANAIDLKPFKYLVIRESVNFTITNGEQVELIIRAAQGQEAPVVKYHQTADTLIIDRISFGPQARTLAVTLHIPADNLQWMRAENSALSLHNFATELLDVHLSKSSLRISAAERTNMGSMEIHAHADSYIQASNVAFDTLALFLDGSVARMPVSIQKLEGSMVHDASLSIQGASNVEFRKDSTSHWSY